jgi:hypothetical protein
MICALLDFTCGGLLDRVVFCLSKHFITTIHGLPQVFYFSFSSFFMQLWDGLVAVLKQMTVPAVPAIK